MNTPRLIQRDKIPMPAPATPVEPEENFVHDKYGYCYYYLENGKRPLIFNLWTEENCRRKGHARRHILMVMEEIRKSGYLGPIDIEAVPKDGSIDRESLVSFYSSLGLTVI